MLPDAIRLSQPTKDQLLRLKRTTGIKQWNILCRWAFCTSLPDIRALQILEHAPMSNVEMTGKVFGGPYVQVYSALLHDDGQRRRIPDAELGLLLQAHVRRGVGALLMAPANLAGFTSSTIRP